MPGESIHLDERFRRAASWISCALGSAWAFVAAVSLVLLWAAAGPFLGYSNNWQLVINTGTTIATFLMLFVLQNSQNRDTKALNLKLDELLRAIEGARTRLVNVNELSDAELSRLEDEFRKLASQEGRTLTTDDTQDATSRASGSAQVAPLQKRPLPLPVSDGSRGRTPGRKSSRSRSNSK